MESLRNVAVVDEEAQAANGFDGDRRVDRRSQYNRAVLNRSVGGARNLSFC
jgi:hypothetical protein